VRGCRVRAGTRIARIGLVGVLAPAVVSQPVAAQSAAQPAATPVLDGWIAARYRGAQLVADSTVSPAPMVHTGAAPRVETVRAGQRSDTLLAVHVGSQRAAPMLAAGNRVRLAGPSGTISPVAAQVRSRRLFRAPRTPDASSATDSTWLYGWAYLVVVPHVDGRPTERYRGWTLLATPEPAPRRRDGARP
jgi:hypothetical protein